jgi:salicylate hydroxylase
MDKSRLLRELLAPLVPRGALHSDKKLRSLRQTPTGTVELNFAHGEVVECDAVIGADGIWSFVRDYVAPQQDASPAGWWECTAAVPSKDLKAALRDAPFGDDAEYHWMGDGLYVLHALVGDRTQGLCLAVVVDSNSPTIPSQPITKEVLKSKLATGTVVHAIPRRIIEVSNVG